MKTRYVITKVDRDGLRTLATANQGRCHFDTKKAANRHLRAILSNNSTSTLESVFGDVKKMKVLAAPCYDHGDCMRTVFGKA